MSIKTTTTHARICDRCQGVIQQQADDTVKLPPETIQVAEIILTGRDGRPHYIEDKDYCSDVCFQIALSALVAASQKEK